MNLTIRHAFIAILLLSLLADVGKTTLSKKDKKKKNSERDKTVDKKASNGIIFTRGVRIHTYYINDAST